MQNIYTVAQVNSYIKNMFTQDFLLQRISVKGEISNLKYHSSGHIYFTLKDTRGTIACVMFAGNRRGLSFKLQEGQQVVVTGSVDVFERDGRYQLYAKQIALDGTGYLYERFERLKRELEERGMFAEEYKQPIPKYIKKLGVVTAPTGAAVQDIINISKRRNPYLQIILFPAIVQGEQAVASIIQGIHAMEKFGVDVIIVGRGGGSLEDLWAFNEEAVAQAIFDCEIPIISAVGHETDTTIADFVSDLRAPTPSAAAELAVFEVDRFEQTLEGYSRQLNRLMKQRMDICYMQIKQFQTKLNYLNPVSQIREKRSLLMKYEQELLRGMNGRILENRHRLDILIQKMKGLSPLDKLNQGFSYTATESGENIHSIAQVQSGMKIETYVKDGIIRSCVQEAVTRERQENYG